MSRMLHMWDVWWRRLVPRRTATYKVLPRRCSPHIPPSLLPSSSSHVLIGSTPATPGVRFPQHQDPQRSPGPQVLHPVSSSTLPHRHDTTAMLCVYMPPRGGSVAVCASVEDLCDLVLFPCRFLLLCPSPSLVPGVSFDARFAFELRLLVALSPC